MILECSKVCNLVPDEVRAQQGSAGFPISAVRRKNAVSEDRLESLFASRWKTEVLELSSKDSLDILRLGRIENLLAQKERTECIHASVNPLVPLLERLPDASLFRESDILSEQIEPEDGVFVWIFGVRFAPIHFDDLRMSLVGDETVDEAVEDVDATEDENGDDRRRSLPEVSLKTRHFGNVQ